MSEKCPRRKQPALTFHQRSYRETVAILEYSCSIRDQIANSVSPLSAAFENVIIPLAQDDNTKADCLKIFAFIGSVSTNSSRKAEKLILQTETEFLMHEDIFLLVGAVLQKHINPPAGDKVGLDTESIRLLRKKHQEYLQNGLNIPLDTQRERFITARSELDNLLTAARKTSTEVDDGIWLSREHLLGVPEGSLATTDESKEDPNMLWATFRKPHFTAVIQNCTCPATRRRMWFAKETASRRM
jgi:metallopeptidase MepB